MGHEFEGCTHVRVITNIPFIGFTAGKIYPVNTVDPDDPVIPVCIKNDEGIFRWIRGEYIEPCAAVPSDPFAPALNSGAVAPSDPVAPAPGDRVLDYLQTHLSNACDMDDYMRGYKDALGDTLRDVYGLRPKMVFVPVSAPDGE